MPRLTRWYTNTVGLLTICCAPGCATFGCDDFDDEEVQTVSEYNRTSAATPLTPPAPPTATIPAR